MTIFDFTDSPSVGCAEDHEAVRIIEAPIDRTGPMLSVSVDAWRKFADQMKDRCLALRQDGVDVLACPGAPLRRS